MKWGLRVELLFILIFIVCLIISTIGLNQLGILGNKNEFSNNGYSYYELEQIVSSGALKFYEERYSAGEDIIIKVSTLISNGYIPNLYDENGMACNGYAKIINSKASIAYIKCPYYQTSGYDSKNE